MKIEEYKKLIRIYVPNSFLDIDNEIELGADQTHYIKNVMRKSIGANLRVFNGKDGEWLAEVSEIKKNNCLITIKEKLIKQKQSRDIWAVASVIKKDALDLMIEKSCELGASKFFPVICDNTVVHKINQERLQAIAVEASEQSERLDVMTVEELLKLEKLIDMHKDRKFVVCLERCNPTPLAKAIPKFSDKNLAIVIGPEGGFSEAEIARLDKKENVIFTSLGNNILRAETALIAALATVQIIFDADSQ